MPLTIEEKLDLMFNEIKDHYGHHPSSSNWERICRLVTDGDGATTGNPDYKNDPFLRGLIDGLESENFIYKRINFPSAGQATYFATVKGLMFEGFANRKDRLQREKDRAIQTETEIRRVETAFQTEQTRLGQRMEKLNVRMVQATIAIAAIGLFAVWSQLIDIWEYYFPHTYWRVWMLFQ